MAPLDDAGEDRGADADEFAEGAVDEHGVAAYLEGGAGHREPCGPARQLVGHSFDERTQPRPFRRHDRDVEVGTSIGMALRSGPGGTVEELLREADAAMYRHKERGRTPAAG